MKLSFSWEEKPKGRFRDINVLFREDSGEEHRLYSSYEDSYGDDPAQTQEQLERVILRFAKWCEDRGLKVLNNATNSVALDEAEKRPLGINWLDLQVGLQNQKPEKE